MKAVVLSSGGIDSTTCLGMAVEKYGKENVIALSLYYGQKHHKEIEASNKVAEYYGVEHITKKIDNIFDLSNCPLLEKSDEEIPHKSYAEQIEEDGMVKTYVPYRNGTILSIAATIATSLFPNQEVEIYYGAHADDAAGNAYADCSTEFIEAQTLAIRLGTYNKVNVVAPLAKLNKSQVVKIGLDYLEDKVPYELTWSCYEGKEKQCGTCGTCLDRKKAFELNGVEDPVGYEN